MPTVPFHTHNFTLPTATSEEMAALASSLVVVTPSNLGSAATQPSTAFATSGQGVLAASAMQPTVYDAASKGFNVYAQAFRDDSPRYYGAVGDGTTNDTTAYQAAEAAKASVFIPSGSTFNLASSLPVDPVTGPGKIRIGGVDVGGLQAGSFPHRSSMYYTPGDLGIADWLYTAFPAGGGQGNTVYGAGSFVGGVLADGSTSTIENNVRNTVFGAVSLVNPVHVERTDAFGQGALRYCRQGERNAAFGTLAMQWGGSDLSLDPTGHYYNHDLIYFGGTPVTDPTWNAEGLETANPGIRATIVAWLGTNPWATTSEQFARNIAVGRDAGVEMVLGFKNTNLGYRSGGLMLAGDFNTNVGSEAGKNNLFGGGNTNVGVDSGYNNQTGSHNTAVGREALYNFINNDRNTGLGYRAGYGCFGGTNNVYIGPFSGNADAGSGHSSRFYVTPGAGRFLVGDMATGKLGLGTSVTFADLANTDGLYIREGDAVGGAAANVSSRGIVIESGLSSTGITIKTFNTFEGQISFADPEDNNDGLIKYTHSTRTMEFRAADTAFMTGDATVVNFLRPISRAGLQVVDTRKTGWAAPTGTATRTTFVTSTVTLPLLAERVKALIDDLTAHGLIGA